MQDSHPAPAIDADTTTDMALATPPALHGIRNAEDPGVQHFLHQWRVEPPLLMMPFLDSRHAVRGYAPLGLSLFNRQDALASMIEKHGWRVDRMESMRHGVKVKATHTLTSGGLLAVPPRSDTNNERNLFMAACALNAQRGMDLFVNELIPDGPFRFYMDLDFRNLSVMSPRQVLEVAAVAQRAVHAFFDGPPRAQDGTPLPPLMPPVASDEDRDALAGSWGVLCVLSTQYKVIEPATTGAPRLYGTGIHGVWPDLVVQLPQALLLRKAIKQALRRHFGRRTAPLNGWGDVVDAGVYKNGLRMPCSSKVEPCPGHVHRSGASDDGALAASQDAEERKPVSLGEALRRARQQQQQPQHKNQDQKESPGSRHDTDQGASPGQTSRTGTRTTAGEPRHAVAAHLRAYFEEENVCPFGCMNGRVNGGRAYWPICVLSRDGSRDVAYEAAFRRSILFMLEQCVIQTSAPLTPGFRVPSYMCIPAYIKLPPADLKAHLQLRQRVAALAGGADGGSSAIAAAAADASPLQPQTWTVDTARAFRPKRQGAQRKGRHPERTRALREAVAQEEGGGNRQLVLQPIEQVLARARTRRELRDASANAGGGLLRSSRGATGGRRPLRSKERAALASAALPPDVDGESLETAVEELLRSPDTFPQHRHWRHLRVRQLLYDSARYRILVDVASDTDDGERYCMNKGTTHRSRGIFFELTAEGLSQRCFSKHKHRGQFCHSYRSLPVPLPSGGRLAAVLQPLLDPHYARSRRAQAALQLAHPSFSFKPRAVSGEGAAFSRRDTYMQLRQHAASAKAASLEEGLNLAYERLNLPRRSAITRLLLTPDQQPVEMVVAQHEQEGATRLRVDETRLGHASTGMQGWLQPAASNAGAAPGQSQAKAAATASRRKRACPGSAGSLGSSGHCASGSPGPGSPAADAAMDAAAADEDGLDAAVVAALREYIAYVTAPDLGMLEIKAVARQVTSAPLQALQVLEVLAANRGADGSAFGPPSAWRDSVLLEEGFMTLEAVHRPQQAGRSAGSTAEPRHTGVEEGEVEEAASSREAWASVGSPAGADGGLYYGGGGSDTDSMSSFASFPAMPLPGQVRRYHNLHRLPLKLQDTPVARRLVTALRRRWNHAAATLAQHEVMALQRAGLHHKPVLRALWQQLSAMLLQRYEGASSAAAGSLAADVAMGGGGLRGRGWSRSKITEHMLEWLQTSVLEPWFEPALAHDTGAEPSSSGGTSAALIASGLPAAAGTPRTVRAEGETREFLAHLVHAAVP